MDPFSRSRRVRVRHTFLSWWSDLSHSRFGYVVRGYGTLRRNMKKGVSTLLSVPIKECTFLLKQGMSNLHFLFTNLYKSLGACVIWFLRYTYIFLHLFQVYAMLSDELTGDEAGHNARQHWFILGTNIRQHMREKWEDSGLAEKLSRDYWKNYWNSWTWKETVKWLRSLQYWRKKKRPRRFAKPPPLGHLEAGPRIPSSLMTVEEYDKMKREEAAAAMESTNTGRKKQKPKPKRPKQRK